MIKICQTSNLSFEIDNRDLEFYKKLELPLPSLSPLERRRRRLAFRNESSLFKRYCEGSGQEIISMYDPTTPFKIYENDYWWSDKWDAFQYGVDFDFSKPFFGQFDSLLKAVPKMARIQQGEQLNSRFTNCASNNKNCYLIFSSNRNEDCFYGTCVNSSRNLFDSFASTDCEIGYEIVHSENCYNCQYAFNSYNSSDCYYIENCIGCSFCFACVNLRNKTYCALNRQLSKKEYFDFIAKIKLSSRTVRQKVLNKFLELSAKSPKPPIYGNKNEDVSGNYIFNSKNCKECFYVHNLEDCAFCDNSSSLRNCYDVSFYGATGTNELLYECEGVGHNVSRVMFSKLIWGGSVDVLYSYECHACQNIFGCTGLKRAKYCIFNKQYSQQEFFKLRAKIIELMKETNEWGEFFPMSISPFAYNQSVAQQFYELTKEQAIKRGLKWKDQDKIQSSSNAIRPEDDIRNTDSNILSTTIICEKSSLSFKIEEKELDFYIKNNIPLPALHYNERYKSRSTRSKINQAVERKCCLCSNLIITANTGNVCCSDCYHKINS